MREVLQKDFFNRPVLEVAPSLVGKFLVRKIGGIEKAFMIIEVEAYDGVKDKANHASCGKTKRTEVMFGEAGVFYVYLVYGMYSMLNIVTGPKKYPAAVLIRGVEGIDGPGKLTRQIKITKKQNNKKAIPQTGLWFEDRGIKINKKKIKRMSRVGVYYAGPIWSKKLYRFILEQ